MISTKHSGKILFEQDADMRNKLVDELSEADAKYMLKMALSAMHKQIKIPSAGYNQ